MMRDMLWTTALALICFFPTLSLGNQDLPSVDGCFGLDCLTGEGYLAILVEVPEGQALSGLVWYNNDSVTVFPGVWAGTGSPGGPPPLSEYVVLADSIQGGNSDWSEVDFDLPVGASLDALYLTFQFPEGDFSGQGFGGGPAIGYLSGTGGSVGWASENGTDWAALHSDYQFAVVPKLVPFTEGMSLKSLGNDAGEEGGAQVVEVVESFLRAGPNPFNPKVEIRFGLPYAGKISLEVYDLRGRRIKQLLKESLESGIHTVFWLGRDDRGHQVASGAYFVRLKTPQKVMTQSLMLVR